MTDTCCNKLTFKWIGALVTIIFAISFMVTGIQVLKTNEYDKDQCIITDVHYPTNLPTINNSDSSNFVTCNCGRRCVSDMGTCVKIFLKRNGTQDRRLLLKNTINNSPKECTFYEKKCKNINIEGRLIAIQKAIERAQTFIDIQKNNMTIDCYFSSQDPEFYYMDNDPNYMLLIVFGSLFSLFSCCLISLFCCSCEDDNPSLTI